MFMDIVMISWFLFLMYTAVYLYTMEGTKGVDKKPRLLSIIFRIIEGEQCLSVSKVWGSSMFWIYFL